MANSKRTARQQYLAFVQRFTKRVGRPPRWDERQDFAHGCKVGPAMRKHVEIKSIQQTKFGSLRRVLGVKVKGV